MENSPGNFGDSADIVAALDPVYETPDLQLYHVPGVINPTTEPSQGAYAAAWIAFGIWTLCLLAGLLAGLLTGVKEALLPRRR